MKVGLASNIHGGLCLRSCTGTGGVFTINSKPLTKPCTTLAEAVAHLTTGAPDQARHPDIRIRPTGHPVQLNQVAPSRILTPLPRFQTGAKYRDLRCALHPSMTDGYPFLTDAAEARLEFEKKERI